MKPELTLLKIGGKVLDDAPALEGLLAAFAALEGPKILVHGGGNHADHWCRRLGIPPRMRQGRRITDEATLEVVTMVYAGLLNKRLVAALQAEGCPALGLSGADADVLRARKRPARPHDFGWAGDVVGVGTQALAGFLGQGLTPVLCSITHDGQGQLLNTNADTIATEVAAALSARYAVRLLLCFDRPGVLSDPADPRSLLPTLSPAAYARLRAGGRVRDGMLPKLDNAFAALRRGVQEVLIGGPALLADSQKPQGTRIVNEN